MKSQEKQEQTKSGYTFRAKWLNRWQIPFLKLMLHGIIFNDNSHRNGLPSQSDFIELHLHCESSLKIGQCNISLKLHRWSVASQRVKSVLSSVPMFDEREDKILSLFLWLVVIKLCNITKDLRATLALKLLNLISWPSGSGTIKRCRFYLKTERNYAVWPLHDTGKKCRQKVWKRNNNKHHANACAVRVWQGLSYKRKQWISMK